MLRGVNIPLQSKIINEMEKKEKAKLRKLLKGDKELREIVGSFKRIVPELEKKLYPR